MGGRRWIGGAALALVVLVAGYAALRAREVQSTNGIQTSNAFTNIRELPSPLVGKAAPRIGLKGVTAAGDLDLQAHRGKLLLVSFWSHF
ncbi:MAG: hypothetical protein ACOY93_13630 [Bacillota bacterium]